MISHSQLSSVATLPPGKGKFMESLFQYSAQLMNLLPCRHLHCHPSEEITYESLYRKLKSFYFFANAGTENVGSFLT